MSNMGEGPLARFKRVKKPIARDEGLLLEDLGDETVIYDNESKEAHCLSPLAAVVFANCDGETTLEQLATIASQRLGEPVDEEDVINALTQLSERDLLAVPPRDGLSRRQMVGKSAAAAGAFAGATLITSIVAPAAIAGGSATCADILCCPCCTNKIGTDPADDSNSKDQCCTTPLTHNCQCVNASNGSRPGPTPGGSAIITISGGKFCKTTGAGAPSDEQCLGTSNPLFDERKPTNTWCTLCYPAQHNTTGVCGSCGTAPTCPHG